MEPVPDHAQSVDSPQPAKQHLYQRAPQTFHRTPHPATTQVTNTNSPGSRSRSGSTASTVSTASTITIPATPGPGQLSPDGTTVSPLTHIKGVSLQRLAL